MPFSHMGQWWDVGIFKSLGRNVCWNDTCLVSVKEIICQSVLGKCRKTIDLSRQFYTKLGYQREKDHKDIVGISSGHKERKTNKDIVQIIV